MLWSTTGDGQSNQVSFRKCEGGKGFEENFKSILLKSML